MADKFNSGQVTLGASADSLQNLGAGAVPGSADSCRFVNPGANPIYLGSDSSVSPTTGYPLLPGQSVRIDVLNPKNLWVAGTAGDKLGWLVTRP